MNYEEIQKILAVLTAVLMLCLVLVAGVFAEGEIPIDEEHCPDANFREYVLTVSDYGTGIKIGTDSGGTFSPAKIAVVTCINVSKDWETPEDEKIADLTYIEYFFALPELHCFDNLLTELDVSNNVELEFLDCDRNQLAMLNVCGAAELTKFWCASNQLTELGNLLTMGIFLKTCFGTSYFMELFDEYMHKIGFFHPNPGFSHQKWQTSPTSGCGKFSTRNCKRIEIGTGKHSIQRILVLFETTAHRFPITKLTFYNAKCVFRFVAHE